MFLLESLSKKSESFKSNEETWQVRILPLSPILKQSIDRH